MIETIIAIALLLIGGALVVAGAAIALGTGPALIVAGIFVLAAGVASRRTIPNG